MSTKPPAMRPTGEDVQSVLDRASGPRRGEVDELLQIHSDVTGEDPVVWAGRIIGFGEYEYRYDSGHGGRASLPAFASGAARHTIYLSTGFAERWPELLMRLGPHKASKACLYLTRLSHVDVTVLRELLELTLADVREG